MDDLKIIEEYKQALIDLMIWAAKKTNVDFNLVRDRYYDVWVEIQRRGLELTSAYRDAVFSAADLARSTL